jgi:hypothetical protein
MPGLIVPDSGNVDPCDACDGILFPYAGSTCGSEMTEPYYGYFFLYLFLLAYAFGGVAVAADLFMGSIEAITAVSKKVKRIDGSTIEILV